MFRRFPLIGSLVAMSEGQALSDSEAAAFVADGRAFVEAANIGYVVIDAGDVTPQLRTLAIEAFELEVLARDGGRTLYRPAPLR